MTDSEILITGANGQLGTALRAKYPGAKATDASELDITNQQAVAGFDWSGIKAIVNAAAYTDVDGAETADGRLAAWKVNAQAVANLAQAANQHELTLVHISTDYVFDGTNSPHAEDEPFSPLGVYGASKAGGDIAAGLADRHYILRTSWVIGEGKNFVRTMLDVGRQGTNPTVVADQIGRPTFTTELVKAVDHLLTQSAPFGLYNLSNDGDPVSWADLSRQIFKLADFQLTVSNTTTAEYFSSKEGVAKRPLNSVLDLAKIKAAGFQPADWRRDLETYVKKELGK